MSTNVYEQAIADAKKLREVAEQNAKNAIIEAITPRVRELIDRELTGTQNESMVYTYEDSHDDEEMSDDDIVLEESAIMELAKEVAGKKKAKDNKKLDTKSKTSKDKSVVEMLNKIINEEDEESDEEIVDKKSSKQKTQKENYKNEDNMNLEELLNEIKMEIDFGEIDDEDIESALLEIMPTVKMLEDKGGDEDVDVEEKSDDDMDMEMDSDEEIEMDSDDMDMEDMDMDMDMEAGGEDAEKEEDSDETFDFSSLMSDEKPSTKKGEKEPKAGKEEEKPVEEMFSINETALTRELQRLRQNRSSNSTNGHQQKSTSTLNESRYREQILKEQRINRTLKGKLDEYRGAVESLRDQLNEMNLFNAKLLYVNKLLQTKGLDSNQKKTIIESIDNAESLREVKLVYKTLSESVNKQDAGSLNESKIRKLASSSSRPTKSGGTLLNESTDQVDRWARLAGLK